VVREKRRMGKGIVRGEKRGRGEREILREKRQEGVNGECGENERGWGKGGTGEKR
jgi:hypothetical protein